MSIAMDRIEPSGFGGGGGGGGGSAAFGSIFESPPICDGKEEEERTWCSSSSTSSIGKNSDLSGGRSSDGEDGEENEVQSSYKGPMVMMNALEEVLPMRRGISRFYAGKSKSFTSLTEATSTSSIKDIAKQENAYTRRRRNLLAINHMWDKNRSFPAKGNGCGISKRPISSSRSTLALAVAMSSSDSISSTSDDSNSCSRSPPHLPPLHPQSRNSSYANIASLPNRGQRMHSPWRSFSVADLQRCSSDATAAAATSCCSLLVDNKTENKELT